MQRHIAVVGAGSWGTALSRLLALNGHEVRIWDANLDNMREMIKDGENARYLPGVKLPESIKLCLDEKDAMDGCDMVLFGVPAQHFRSALLTAIPMMPDDVLVVNVAKGIDQKSLMRMSEIAYDVKPEIRYVVLSGPSHAEEVGLSMPTTVAVASKDIALAEEVQDIFMNDFFRVYTNDDVAGLELGGSLKNIIALGAGIADGLGYGDNAKAAMMTRGITEMVRLGEKLGAKKETFSGLSGIGDLIVTCTSMHSRNRRCGILIGQGVAPDEAVKQVGMVVEGMYTADSAYRLAKQLGVEMPITEAIYKVVNGELDAKTAVSMLMSRARKHENEDLIKN